MTLRKAHALSAAIVAVFVSVHMANHLAGLAGSATHIAFMEAARSVYRLSVIEWLLSSCVALQIVTGLTLFVRSWKSRQGSTSPSRFARPRGDSFSVAHWRGLVPSLQAISGALLALFLIVHVGAVLFGRWALNLDTNFYFAAAGFHVAPFQYFFAPYYFLGVSALFTHVACAAYRRSRSRSRMARLLILAVPSTIGVMVSVLIVLSLAGALFPVEIPAEYKATYALPGR